MKSEGPCKCSAIFEGKGMRVTLAMSEYIFQSSSVHIPAGSGNLTCILFTFLLT
jgi:hypothetical protein